MKILIGLLSLLMLGSRLQAQTADTTGFFQFQKQELIRGTNALRYRILYPENYNRKKSYPLLVFLHGSGERGSDNEKQLWNGGALFLKDSVRKQFSAIVIFPQCPADSTWSPFNRAAPRDDSFYLSLNQSPELTTPERLVKALMDSLSFQNIADKKRLYISGLSLGGFGTYDLLVHYPDYFAAAFSICGMTNVPVYAAKAATVPLWIFHGSLDDVVNPQPNRELYKVLQNTKGTQVKFTEYPTANHNSWDSAFAEPGLLPWLFAQKRNN